MTTVIHVRAINDAGREYVYIGRANGYYGFMQSKWHNPFKVKSESQRPAAIAAYRDYLIHERMDLVAVLQEELRGNVLVCWCAPRACHGDVLAELADLPFPLTKRCVCGCLGVEHVTVWEGDEFKGTRCAEHGGHKFAMVVLR